MTDIELKRHPETGELVPEEWKEVDGYGGWYEVSNYGRVRSWRNNARNRRSEPKILKPEITKGYYGVYLCRDDGKKHHQNHRLTAMMFVDNPENKPQVNHDDGNKLNNFHLNLEWCTLEENLRHAYDTGLTNNTGENNGRSKLKRDDVVEMRRLFEVGDYSYIEMGDIFGVSRTVARKVINKESWKHI